ncbi:poly-beta-1,6-N-acetyl-D-glucosamine N-deacetylase PgaB [Paenibacillus rigui]|uniref:poly-beta-1,6-N-acetyl-D-glucosamine N-deacetylase PgaB n=1 Tax=Paenibacillus rigui TaxID=554312 RepID=UPI001FE73CA1|nr:poly-beta-1,6-N-acetyl-D-glucosamine N-deacetylase PgaB [Paenibacillus rigui]
MLNRLLGPSIQIDPTFPYYKNRSEQSIADELAMAGYRVVHYFVTVESEVNGKLVDCLKANGFAVWAMVLGNGTYTTAHLPQDWPDWQMTLLKPVNDGYYRLSPFSYRYVAWKKQALVELVKAYPFDGIEVAEPYFPEWNGLSSGVYGDVGPYARAAFKQQYGSDIPDFKYRSSPYYYKNNPALYRQWIEFRVDAVNRYLNEWINGKHGIRAARPDICVATWSLAVDAGPDAVEKLRELQGNDAFSMVSMIRPDVHFIQTHWPDWMRPRLKPDYIKHYEPFVAKLKIIHPRLPLGIQTDIGSLKPMRRSRQWLEAFAQTAVQLGYATWTAYEYHLGLYMYEEPPLPMQAVRVQRNQVLLLCSKRIDPETATTNGRFQLADGEQELLNQPDIQIRVLKVDGSSIVLDCPSFPTGSFQLKVSHIQDTPELFLFPEKRANVLTSPVTLTVPAMEGRRAIRRPLKNGGVNGIVL